MDNVALFILFNHNYEKNIERLENIYEKRFSNIYFVMPFYSGGKENVLPVYENSFYFQGYVVQALSQLKNKTFKHYIFIGDDLILNPVINEDNYQDYFAIDSRKAFIPEFFSLNDPSETKPYRPFAPYWIHQDNALEFKVKQDGIEVSKYLPSFDEAKRILNTHGIDFNEVMPRTMFVPKPLLKKGESFVHNLKRIKILMKNFRYLLFPPKIPYPLTASYSDILILPNNCKEKFMLFAGVFSALHLFVEMAIPTALAFSASEITTEKDLKMKGHVYWGINDFNKLSIKFKKSMNNLLENFPEDCLYIHPVKLSQWNSDIEIKHKIP